MKCLQKLMPPSIKSGRNSTHNLLEFIRAGVELAWAHDTSTADRSQINDTAEKRRPAEIRKGLRQRWFRVACRKNGGTSQWNAIIAPETCVTPRQMARLRMKKRIHASFHGLVIMVGPRILYEPINPKKVEARWHELGAKMCILGSSGCHPPQCGRIGWRHVGGH